MFNRGMIRGLAEPGVRFIFGFRSPQKISKLIQIPNAAIGKPTLAMLQRWVIDLSTHNYTISHQPRKQLPHADYLSRHTYPPSTATHFLKVLLIDRNQLIAETRLALDSVLAGLR